MRRIATARIASLLAALTAGVLAAYALRSGPSETRLARVQQPPAEVRTQVIRRTVHVVRHERAHAHRAGASVHGTAGGSGTAVSAGSTAPRTATSGSHAASGPASTGAISSGSAPRTRSSGAGSGSTGTSPGHRRTAPVRTHSSGSGSSAPSSSHASQPVRTRTSGGSGSGSTGAGSGAVRTRTSGGGEHEGGRDD